MDISETTPLWCSLDSAIHPAWKSWEENTIAWMDRFQLDGEQLEAGRLRGIVAGELAARTVLNPQHAEGPRFATDSLMWLFAFDDAYCDEGRYSHNPSEMALLVADMVRIVEVGETTSTSPCARALADLRQRLDEIASHVQISRWVHAMRGYLHYQVWEAACRQSDVIPTINQYSVARIRNGSMEVCAMSLDIAEGYEVPAVEMERPEVRALTEIACCIVGLDNDIASYYKEHTRGGDKINLVDVVANERGQTPNEALPEVLTYRDAVLGLYLRLSNQVEPMLSAESRRYLSGLSAWIRGNLDWSEHTARYRKAGQPTIQVVDTPYQSPVRVSPPDGVAWWWSLELWPEQQNQEHRPPISTTIPV